MSSEINPSHNEVVETVLHDPHQTQDTTHIREQIAGIEKEMVNLNVGSSSHTDELKELGSDQVWEHFESLQGEDGTEWAVCNYCRKKLVGSINIGTKHLQNHFKRCARKRKIGGRHGDHKPANGDTSLLDYNENDKVIQRYEEKKKRIGRYLKDLSYCGFCLSISEYRKYILLWINFIDDDWCMKKMTISVRKIEEDSNFLKCIKDVLLEWGIDKNVSSIIRFCTNEKDVAEYFVRFDEMKSWFSGPCSFPFAGKLLYTNSLQSLTFDYQYFLNNLADIVRDKISQIFKYVQEASSKEQNFQIATERAKSLGKKVTARVIDEEVHDDAKVRLKTAIGYKEAFFELENMDTEFKEINLTKEEWDQALALNNSFEELFDDFPDSYWEFETENMDFVFLCDLYTKSLLLRKFHLFFGDSEETFYCFGGHMDDCWSKNNFVVAAAAVLDPRFKLDIVQYWYKKIYGNEWKRQFRLFEDYFTDAYKEYARPYSSQSQPSDSLISSKMLDPSGRPCKSSNNLEDVSLRKSELDLFLEEVKFPSSRVFDVLKWWYGNEKYFPTLARMARDFLPINLSDDNLCSAFQYLDADGIEYWRSDRVREAIICTEDWSENFTDEEQLSTDDSSNAYS